MDDDFFHDIHRHVEPPIHPHENKIQEKFELPKSEAEKLLEKQKAERELKKKQMEEKADLETENQVIEDKED